MTYDRDVDVLCIRFGDGEVTTRHVADDTALDYDGEGRLAGIEILGASTVIRALPMPEVTVEVL